MTLRRKGFLRPLQFTLRYNRNHADPCIEGLEHLSLSHATLCCQPFEDRRQFPRAKVDLCAQPFWQNTWQVLRQPAARDMGQCRNRICLQGRNRPFDIKPCGRQQRATKRAIVPRAVRIPAQTAEVHNLAHQRKAVGVHAVTYDP